MEKAGRDEGPASLIHCGGWGRLAVQAPQAGTWGRWSGPSGLVLPCRHMCRGLPPDSLEGTQHRKIQTLQRKMPRGGPRRVVLTEEVTVLGTWQAPEIPG